MDWHNLIAAKLPDSQKQDPPGLREGIIAELQDHLEIAYRRELLQAENPDQAVQQVLQEFGDPAEIARQLWFDAMKGRIIMNKLSVIAMTIVSVCCLSMLGLMWNMVSAQAEFQRQQVELQQRQVQQFAETLQQSLKSQASQSVIYSGDWQPIKVRLANRTEQNKDREYRITLQRSGGLESFSQSNVPAPSNFTEITLKPGMAHDFGYYPPGHWMITAFDRTAYQFQKSFFVGPGRNGQEIKIDVPPDDIEIPRHSQQFKIRLPESFLSSELKDAEKSQLKFQLLIAYFPPDHQNGETEWQSLGLIDRLTIDVHGNVLQIQTPHRQELHRYSPILSGDKFLLAEGKYWLTALSIIKPSTEQEPAELYSDAIRYRGKGQFFDSDLVEFRFGWNQYAERFHDFSPLSEHDTQADAAGLGSAQPFPNVSTEQSVLLAPHWEISASGTLTIDWSDLAAVEERVFYMSDSPFDRKDGNGLPSLASPASVTNYGGVAVGGGGFF